MKARQIHRKHFEIDGRSCKDRSALLLSTTLESAMDAVWHLCKSSVYIIYIYIYIYIVYVHITQMSCLQQFTVFVLLAKLWGGCQGGLASPPVIGTRPPPLSHVARCTSRVARCTLERVPYDVQRCTLHVAWCQKP